MANLILFMNSNKKCIAKQNDFFEFNDYKNIGNNRMTSYYAVINFYLFH